ncbi:hypothetical protein D3C81_2184350 [compost metagenome]
MGVLRDAPPRLYVQQAGPRPLLHQRQPVLTDGTDVAPVGLMVAGKGPGQGILPAGHPQLGDGVGGAHHG